MEVKAAPCICFEPSEVPRLALEGTMDEMQYIAVVRCSTLESQLWFVRFHSRFSSGTTSVS